MLLKNSEATNLIDLQAEMNSLDSKTEQHTEAIQEQKVIGGAVSEQLNIDSFFTMK